MGALRWLGFLILAALFCVDQTHAADSTSSTDSVSVPDCGLACIVEAIVNNSTCSLTDTTCICSTTSLNEAASICITTSCRIRDQLATEKYSKTTCGVEGEDRTKLVWIIGVVFGALGLLVFGLRVVARLAPGPTRSWGSDDWVMALAVVFMVPLAALSVPLANLGLGKDMWTVDPDNITKILYVYFWDELIYLAVLPITKISILLFYLKIFPKKQVRIAVWVLIGLNIAYLVVFEVISIFQCTPIQGAWLRWDGEFEATCRDINMQGWAAAGLNLVLDLAVLILPLPELAALSLSLRKKIQILSMFCVGFFVTIVSLLRLQSLAKYANTSNLTQDYVEVGYWSTIEVPVGIMCACMPALRALLAVWAPKLFETTQRDRQGYVEQSDPSSKSWSFGKLSMHSKSIRVKTEWTVRSQRAQEDGSSVMELVPTPTSSTPKQQQAPGHAEQLSSSSLRPQFDLGDMKTTCEPVSRKSTR